MYGYLVAGVVLAVLVVAGFFGGLVWLLDWGMR